MEQSVSTRFPPGTSVKLGMCSGAHLDCVHDPLDAEERPRVELGAAALFLAADITAEHNDVTLAACGDLIAMDERIGFEHELECIEHLVLVVFFGGHHFQ